MVPITKASGGLSRLVRKTQAKRTQERSKVRPRGGRQAQARRARTTREDLSASGIRRSGGPHNAFEAPCRRAMVHSITPWQYDPQELLEDVAATLKPTAIACDLRSQFLGQEYMAPMGGHATEGFPSSPTSTPNEVQHLGPPICGGMSPDAYLQAFEDDLDACWDRVERRLRGGEERLGSPLAA
ncbi:MAG: hypothetical protein LQ347_000497 [Umbilicaria vellea]|nr:MAG: hypothetical protein LQ347_000497 [Umbilicaria vellea]